MENPVKEERKSIIESLWRGELLAPTTRQYVLDAESSLDLAVRIVAMRGEEGQWE